LGAPGAGKGTQAIEVARAKAWLHVASGDLFREVRESDTELGRLVKSYYDKGALVPDEVAIRMILERLAQPDSQKGVLLDGFPRTLPQGEALDGALAAKGERVDRAVYLKVSDAELLRRLGGRWLCRSCGAPYHVAFSPPREACKCDRCGGELYQRADDTEETAKNRLKVFFDQTEPLIGYYQQRGNLVEVNGEQSVDAVREDLMKVLDA